MNNYKIKKSRLFFLFLMFFFNFFYLLKPSFVFSDEHPNLLINKYEIEKIITKISKNNTVKKAFEGMNFFDQNNWSKTLVENSFFYLISGDQTAKNNALTIFEKKTNGPNRFNPQINSSGPNYTVAFPCTSLALSYDFLYRDLTEDQKNNGKNLLIEWGEALYNRYKNSPEESNHNFHTGAIGCLGIIGILFEDIYPKAKTWTIYTKNSLSNFYFSQAYNPGGDYIEGNYYQYYGLAPTLLFASAYERKYQIDIISNKNIINFPEFATYALMSEKKYPRYGDNSNTMMNGEIFYLIKKNEEKKENKISAFLWTWEQIRGKNLEKFDTALFKDFDRLGIVLYYPEKYTSKSPDEVFVEKSKIFPSLQGLLQGNTDKPGGMASLRTGWTDNKNITLWIVNRWRWQNHQRYDPNHFFLSAFGEKLILSENERNYEDPLRGKLSQHNTILIDDQDCPEGNFVTGSASSLGKFTDFFSNEAGSLIVSDSRFPHACFSKQNLPNYFFGNATENNVRPIIQAERSIILLKEFSPEPYVLVLDEFNHNNSPKNYSWQAYIPKGLQNIRGNGTINNPFSFKKNGVTLKIIIESINNFSFEMISNLNGRNDQLIKVNQNNSEKGIYLVLLFPYLNDNDPIRKITKIKADSLIVLEIEFKDGKKNLIIYNHENLHYTYNNLSTDGKILILEENIDSIKNYLILMGKNFIYQGQTLLSTSNPVSLVSSIPARPPTRSTPTPTPNPQCLCLSNNVCHETCPVNQEINYWRGANNSGISYVKPMKCSPINNNSYQTPPTNLEKNQFCNRNLRPKGDVDGDGKITLTDYLHYVQAFSGGKVSKTINIDTNGDGLITPDDGTIIRENLE